MTVGCLRDNSWSTMRSFGEVVESDGAPQVVLEIDEVGGAARELSGVGEIIVVGAGDLADGDGHRWMTCWTCSASTWGLRAVNACMRVALAIMPRVRRVPPEAWCRRVRAFLVNTGF